MVGKIDKDTATNDAGPQYASSVKDSAQQIWQAGLGAFAKAQAEGTRAFEALVKEGSNLQRKTQAAAEEKLAEATNTMSNMATDISSKASGRWDRLETIFEERVAKALQKLGVPLAKDINALSVRMDELNKSVQKLARASVSRPAKAAATNTGAAPSRRASTARATKTSTAKAAAKRRVATKNT